MHTKKFDYCAYKEMKYKNVFKLTLYRLPYVFISQELNGTGFKFLRYNVKHLMEKQGWACPQILTDFMINILQKLITFYFNIKNDIK